MEIRETTQTTYTTLAPVGELDANSSIYMDEKLTQVLADNRVNIHINCSEMSYISSAGLGVFISYLDEINTKGGKMVFSHMSENVLDVFELLGLNQLVTICQNTENISEVFHQ